MVYTVINEHGPNDDGRSSIPQVDSNTRYQREHEERLRRKYPADTPLDIEPLKPKPTTRRKRSTSFC